MRRPVVRHAPGSVRGNLWLVCDVAAIVYQFSTPTRWVAPAFDTGSRGAGTEWSAFATYPVTNDAPSSVSTTAGTCATPFGARELDRSTSTRGSEDASERLAAKTARPRARSPPTPARAKRPGPEAARLCRRSDRMAATRGVRILQGGPRFIEESAAGTGVYDPDALAHDPEAAPRHVLVSTEHDDGARANVLRFADDLGRPVAPEVVRSLGGIFEQSGTSRRLRGDMVGGRYTSHQLQRRRPVILAQGHRGVQAGLDDARVAPSCGRRPRWPCPVLDRPVLADGQAGFVGFPGGLATSATSRTLPDPLPCISSFTPACATLVQDVVTHQRR